MLDETLIETNPQFLLLLRVWFATLWRTWVWMLPLFVVGAVAGIVIGVAASLSGADKETAQAVARPVGFIIAVPGVVWAATRALKQVLGKSFSGYRLLLIRPEE